MARIHINSITCINQQESGSDEIYFDFNDLGRPPHHHTSNTMYSIDEEVRDEYHTVYPSENFQFQNNVALLIHEDDFPFGSNAGGNDELVFSRTYREPASNERYNDVFSYFSEEYNSEYRVSVTVWGDGFFG
jgi:hypothetical protein